MYLYVLLTNWVFFPKSPLGRDRVTSSSVIFLQLKEELTNDATVGREVAHLWDQSGRNPFALSLATYDVVVSYFLYSFHNVPDNVKKGATVFVYWAYDMIPK